MVTASPIVLASIPDEGLEGDGVSEETVRPLIVYHGDCPDGFGAAFAAWKRYGDEADYVPVNHGDPPPDFRGRHVLVADFAYDRQTTLGLPAWWFWTTIAPPKGRSGTCRSACSTWNAAGR